MQQLEEDYKNEPTSNHERVTLTKGGVYGTGIQKADRDGGISTVITGCQAMTGETMGQNIDDGAITSSVKTQLASDKLVTLSRVGVETNNGVVYLTGDVETAEQKSHIGSVASHVKGVKQVVNNLQVIKR